MSTVYYQFAITSKGHHCWQEDILCELEYILECLIVVVLEVCVEKT